VIWSLYHQIVRHRIRKLFAALNAGDARPIIEQFTAHHEHYFLGEHALSGRRSSLEATTAWYGRLQRLLPDIQFDLKRIDVRGPPWDTLAVIEWDETNSGTDGVRTRASGVHVAQLRWGRTFRLGIYADTAALTSTLARIAAKGTTEALADPIT